jgi:hypothetical protein
MKFLIIYQEMGLEPSGRANERHEILKQLAPSFEKGLLEDVIFLSSVKPRPHEIIDLPEKPEKIIGTIQGKDLFFAKDPSKNIL